MPSLSQLELEFGSGTCGVGGVLGPVSDGLANVDIETTADDVRFREAVHERSPGLLDRLPRVKTPGHFDGTPGAHYYFKLSPECFTGDNPLTRIQAAKRLDPDGKVRTTVEVRGKGHYTIFPGSPGRCHPTGREYEHVSGPAIEDAPRLTDLEYEAILEAAYSLNEWFEDASAVADRPATSGGASGARPGEDFEVRGPSIGDLLRGHGWALARQGNGVEYWRRPGKPVGSSATVGFCKTGSGRQKLYVFSTGAGPFQAGKAYSKFAVLAMLEHGGDYSAAARTLASEGYGGQSSVSSSGGFQRPSPTPSGTVPATPPPKATLNVVRLSTVRPKAVTYLWDGLVPRGMHTQVSGPPGVGKGLLSAQIARWSTTGATPFPGSGVRCKPRGVLLLGGEDPLAEVVVPRLLAAQADMGLVYCFDSVSIGGVRRPFTMPDHADALEEFVVQNDVDLVVFDPLVSCVNLAADLNSEQDVRASLFPLSGILERTGAAFWGARHFSKAGAQSGSALYRALNSVAFTALARSELHIGWHPRQPHLRALVQSKTNLSGPIPAALFTVKTVNIPGVGDEPVIEFVGLDHDLAAKDLRLEGEPRKGQAAAPGRSPTTPPPQRNVDLVHDTLRRLGASTFTAVRDATRLATADVHGALDHLIAQTVVRMTAANGKRKPTVLYEAVDPPSKTDRKGTE